MLSKIQYRLRMLGMLKPFAHGATHHFLLIFILSLTAMLLSFANPYFYKIFIDDVIIGGKSEKMIIVITGYLSVYFAGVLIGYIKNHSGYKLVNTVLYRVKLKIFTGYFKLSFSEYESISIGDMKMRLDDDTSQVAEFAGSQTIDYIISYFTMLMSAAVLIFIDWRLFIFSVFAIPLTFRIDNILSKHENMLNDSNRENDQNMSAWLFASVQGWREVKALAIEKRQKRLFIGFLHSYALYYAKWINYWTARALIVPKIKDEFFMQFGLYFIGGLLIAAGKLRISDLLLFAVYYTMMSDSIKSVSAADAELQSNMSITNRLIEQLLKSEKSEVLNKAAVPDSFDSIVMENVCFSYPNADKEVLHDFSLEIKKGERVAITGKSGGGKTTILKLITGMINPSKGQVLFSGINLKDIDLPAMHERIGFVMQENKLFNTSIRENLLYCKGDADDGELFAACEKAYISDFIKSLPDGLDTVIGEKGIKLSGGQRQRIVLARLFLRDVDVFIFDEATSALDQYSENIIQDAVKNISQDKTIIVVAHRESSVRLCSRKIEI